MRPGAPIGLPKTPGPVLSYSHIYCARLPGGQAQGCRACRQPRQGPVSNEHPRHLGWDRRWGDYGQ